MKTRIEKDPMGEREVPADAYYGIQTARAIENFPISGLKPFPAFVKATALIKLAAARVNARAGASSWSTFSRPEPAPVTT